jgi:hypothetical protein
MTSLILFGIRKTISTVLSPISIHKLHQGTINMLFKDVPYTNIYFEFLERKDSGLPSEDKIREVLGEEWRNKNTLSLFC